MNSLRSFTFVVTLVFACGWVAQYGVGQRGGLFARPAIAAAAQASAESAQTEPEESQTESQDATASTGDDEKTNSQARQVLQRARDRLRSSAPVQAEMREVVRIGARRLKAAGRYIQGKDLKLRLDLAINTDAGKVLGGSMLQVCDGQVLWTRHEVAGDLRITRRDVGQILKAVQEHGAVERNVLVAELGLGGLPALLASIEDAMSFSAVRDETVDGNVLHVLEGTWSKDTRARLVQPGAQPSDLLPAHVPDSIRIYLDENDFPHRIVYLKKDESRETTRPMVTLGFLWNDEPVDEKAFNFAPPDGVIPEELTNAYIERLTRAPINQPMSEPEPSALPQE